MNDCRSHRGALCIGNLEDEVACGRRQGRAAQQHAQAAIGMTFVGMARTGRMLGTVMVMMVVAIGEKEIVGRRKPKQGDGAPPSHDKQRGTHVVESLLWSLHHSIRRESFRPSRIRWPATCQPAC